MNSLSESEISIILQALMHFQYTNPHITEEQYCIANQIMGKIEDCIQGGEICVFGTKI